MPLEELVLEATAAAEEVFVELTSMGLSEEDASNKKTKSIITLLSSLKLVKSTMLRPRNAKVSHVAVTQEGRDVMVEPSAIGGVRVTLVRRLIGQSAELTTVLRVLHDQGPFALPILSRTAGSPSRGAAYLRAVEEGIDQFLQRMPQQNGHAIAKPAASKGARKPTAGQILAAAQAATAASHPAGALRNFSSLIPVATALGLLWTDNEQINDVVAAHSIGSAASNTVNGYVPNTPTWEQIGSAFVPGLVQAYDSCADRSGFATIEAVRGFFGRTLQLAPPIVDDLLRTTRELGDERQLSFTVQFEPNDELIHSKARHPLIWRRHAYDFLELRPSNANLSSVPSKASILQL